MARTDFLRVFTMGTVALAMSGGCVDESSTKANVYERCEETADCSMDGGTTICTSVTTDTGRRGEMCTLGCTSDDDCPNEGACLMGGRMDGDGGTSTIRVCYSRCSDDFSCPYGFACEDDAVGGMGAGRICVPD